MTTSEIMASMILAYGLMTLICSGVTRALIGGGGVYSYIRVLPDGFRISFEIKFISKEIRRAEHEYYTPPPPPINALVTPLLICEKSLKNKSLPKVVGFL